MPKRQMMRWFSLAMSRRQGVRHEERSASARVEGGVDLRRIRDQLSLPARSVSQEEILLRERQLTTSYTYSGSVGISYTFGSPLAKIVNRRFAGSVGTMSVVQ